MKTSKRVLSVLLVALMLLTSAPLGGVTDWFSNRASAFSARTTMPTSDNAYYYANNPFYKSGYGLPNCTCYAFGRAWEVTGKYPKLSTNGAGDWYAYNKSKNYYSYGTTPRPGSIVCWSGHVAFVESVNNNGTINFSESNWSGRTNPNKKFRYQTNINPYTYTSGFQGYIYVVDGDGSIDDKTAPTGFADLGNDFYGTILNTACWKPISQVSGTDHIYLQTEDGSAKQKWHFQRQEDGAYVISSCYNGKVLEMYCGDTSICNHVSACGEFWGGMYQQWYLIPQGNGYVFLSKHFSELNRVMDLYGGLTNDGNIIQINERNNSNAQIWSVYTGDDVQLKATTLDVDVGTSKTNTTFNWNNIYGASSYHVKIWKDKLYCGDSFHTEWNALSGYKITLPAGTYQAYVDTVDYFNCLQSNIVTFTVPDKTIPIEKITSTNYVATSQTVTLTMSDNVGIAGYYWGTNSNYVNNTYTSVGSSPTSATATKTVSTEGTYYLTVKDTAGNVSTVSKTFYKTTLNANGGSVSPGSVITMSDDSFTLPTPIRTGYIFNGWNTKSDGTGTNYKSGDLYKDNKSVTLYAMWTENHTHSYTSKITKSPTCTATGVKTYTCSCGDSYTETIAKTAHSYTSKTTTSTYLKSGATCTSPAVYYYKCASCSAKGTTTYTYGSALGHTESDWIFDDDGTKHIECTVCHVVLRTETAEECDHSEKRSEYVVTPTCTQPGKLVYICDLCDEQLGEEDVAPLGHSFDSETVTKATLSKNGAIVQTCFDCGAKKTVKTIYYPKTFAVAAQVYTGKALKPAVTVKDSAGKTISSANYTVTYANNVAIGTATAKVTFKGNYSGTKTLTFAIVPAQVSKPKATQTTNSVTLSWGKVAGSNMRYYVFSYNPGTKKYTCLGYTTGTSYTVKKLTSGTTYYYAVQAYNTTAKKWGKVSSVLTTATKPGTPTLKAVAGTRKATLSWNKQSGATGYLLYMATSKNGKYTKIATLNGNSRVSFTKTGLTKGRTYYFKVIAYKTVGSTNIYSAYSSVKYVKVK